MDERYINSIFIGIIISSVMIIIAIVESLASVHLSISLGKTLLDSAEICLLVWIIAIVICSGTGYIAARQSRALIHGSHDAVSIAFIAGATVGFINGTDRYLILPIVTVIAAGHFNSLPIMSLGFSLISGSIIVVVSSFIYGAIAMIGGSLYFSRKMKRDGS